MPDKEVKTIQDLIFYQYAKIIAKSSFGIPDGQAAKREHYGFIKNKFQELRDGIMSWSDILREDLQFVEFGEKKYLKTMYYCHKCADTLDKGDLNGMGTAN